MSDNILTGGYVATIGKDLLQGQQYKTPILDAFFKRKEYVSNGVVAVPTEVSFADDLLSLINPEAGVPVGKLDYAGAYNYFALKHFGDAKLIKPNEIERIKRQLQNLSGENYSAMKVEIVSQQINRLIQKTNATREYMAGCAILGTIKDKDGNEIYNFGIPASNKLGTKKVSDDTDKLALVLNELEATIRNATRYMGGYGLVVGEGAYEKILQSPSYQRVQERRMATAGQVVDGAIDYIGRRPILLADKSYYDKSKTRNKFFDTDTIALAPTDLFSEFYTHIATNEGEFRELAHIDSFKQNNPDGTTTRLQTATMPIPTLPNAIATATLS